MDISALETLNALIGNERNEAGIEWALTGGEVEFTELSIVAVGGADAAVTLNGNAIDSYQSCSAKAGDVLSIGVAERGRFIYVAVAGGIDCPPVMRSRSTYLPGEFGGIGGRRLRTGDELKVGDLPKRRHHLADPLPLELKPPLERESIRLVARDSGADLIDGEWTVSAASDRTGYRISGPKRSGGASITSEPVCPGVIQLPVGGEPIVLMSDAPTIGGYRILGAVISADLGAFAQLAPGASFRFAEVTVEVAQRELLADTERLTRIREWRLG